VTSPGITTIEVLRIDQGFLANLSQPRSMLEFEFLVPNAALQPLEDRLMKEGTHSKPTAKAIGASSMFKSKS
jgi:hypothetical protein